MALQASVRLINLLLVLRAFWLERVSYCVAHCFICGDVFQHEGALTCSCGDVRILDQPWVNDVWELMRHKDDIYAIAQGTWHGENRDRPFWVEHTTHICRLTVVITTCRSAMHDMQHVLECARQIFSADGKTYSLANLVTAERWEDMCSHAVDYYYTHRMMPI